MTGLSFWNIRFVTVVTITPPLTTPFATAEFVQIRPQTMRLVATASTLIITPQQGGDLVGSLLFDFDQVAEDQFQQTAQRDSVRLSFLFKQPDGELMKLIEGGGRCGSGRGCGSRYNPVCGDNRRGGDAGIGLVPESGECFNKVATVRHGIPELGKPAKLLHAGKIEHAGREDFVGGMRAVDHFPFGVMTGDWRPT